jgi:hypothetical protein
MNGDSRETGKTTPEGKPDPSVFSTESNPAGIQLGTAVCLMVRSGKFTTPSIGYRDLWGANKRADLLDSINSYISTRYQSAKPSKANRFSLRPSSVTTDYDLWPRPVDLCAEAPISGLQEMRGEALIDIDQAKVRDFARAYYDPDVPWDELQALGTGLTDAENGFDQEVREIVQEAESFSEDRVKRYSLYPFDSRWCYWTAAKPLWNRAREKLVEQKWEGNSFFIARMFAERAKEGSPVIVTDLLPDYHLLRPNAVAIPFRIRPQEQKDDGHHGRIKAREDVADEPKANLSKNTREYLSSLGLEDPDANVELAATVWQHSLAIGNSRAYLAENIYGVRYNWPRIPLPGTSAGLLKSAKLGKHIASLLNTEAKVEHVDHGVIRQHLRAIGEATGVVGVNLDPAHDLLIDAGWGHEGKDGITMPGTGRIEERDYNAAEREAIAHGANTLDLTVDEAFARLGEKTYDIYLNDRAYWKNIPAKVWDYYIGGYQVIKKWLSYREGKLLGRAITIEEARYVRDMARRIAALCLLQPQLDENYAAVKAHIYPWPGADAPS